LNEFACNPHATRETSDNMLTHTYMIRDDASELIRSMHRKINRLQYMIILFFREPKSLKMIVAIQSKL
jgi:hypothetical protein